MAARTSLLLIAVMEVSGVLACAYAADPPAGPSFRADVAPILVRKCLGCHNDKKAEGGLDISTYARLRRGGTEAGDLIIEPGDPDSSYLIESVRGGAARAMPLKQPRLKAQEIAILARWVEQGARFDGPSPETTFIASLVDPLKGLPEVPVKTRRPEAVSALAAHPAGKWLAAAMGARVVLFDPGTNKAVAELTGHPGPITALVFSPAGQELIAAGGRPGMFGAVTVWNLASRAKRLELRGHTDAILGAAVSADGTTLATAGYDRQILLWSLANGAVLRTLKEHTDAVLGVSFSPDGKVLASCSADRTVKLWDWRTGRRIATLSGASGELYSVTFAEGGSRVLAAGEDRLIDVWPAAGPRLDLERSVFAHDGPIVRLALSPDGKMLASSGADRRVKLWDLPSLKPCAELPLQPDWAQGLAFSSDGRRLAIGRFDGTIELVETGAGKTNVVLQAPAHPQAAPAPVVGILRKATLDPPNPRGAVRGSKVRLTLSGQGVGQTTAVVLPEPGMSATIVPAKSPDANRVQVDLEIAHDARVGVHALGVITPLGVPPLRSFAVSEFPEAAEAEPDDEPARGRLVSLPATLIGTIQKPGDLDHYRFEAHAGQELVFETTTAALDSSIEPALTVLDEHGKALDFKVIERQGQDPVLTCSVPKGGTLTLRVADSSFRGSGKHFYRISAGRLPLVRSVFPMGAPRGETTRIHLTGSNLEQTTDVKIAVGAGVAAGSIVPVPLAATAGMSLVHPPSIVVADGPQLLEQEKSDDPLQALRIPVPGGVSGRIGHDHDVDDYRFKGNKGERVMVEVFARRLGSPLDPVVEVLDAKGRSIPRALLRPLDQTEIAFRDHGSKLPGIRLTRWSNFEVNDYVLMGRELARILALPRNVDDDCMMWNEGGQRLGMLGTTPEHHPLGQPMYKVEILPPGAAVPAGGVAPVALAYRNDDAGPSFLGDSLVDFDVPQDGEYIVRVQDVRGMGDDDFGYHLVVRRSRPDFTVSPRTENPNIPRGGTTLVGVNLRRIDGFDQAVEVHAEGLPPGVRCTPARIGPGEIAGVIALTAEPSAPAYSPPSWTLVAVAKGDSTGHGHLGEIRKQFDPGGARSGWITVTGAPNLRVAAQPARLVIRPGEEISMTLSVERRAGLKGRVPIEVRNLPQGVRVLDIGLNGVLITETQTERSVRLFAEPWVHPQVRPAYAVAQAEAAGTEHSSLPIELHVLER